MPILPAEPELFPEGLFDDESEVLEGRWWVLHTKPRQEKSLARWLQSSQVVHYLPTLPRRNRIRGRIMTARIPLFTGYLFIHADRERRQAALASNRVARCLEVNDQAGFWDDLRQVYRLVNSGLPIMPEDRLAPGMEVEVTQGPLRGLHGVVLRAATGHRFVVRVNFIQQGASVLIDDCALLPLSPISALGA